MFLVIAWSAWEGPTTVGQVMIWKKEKKCYKCLRPAHKELLTRDAQVFHFIQARLDKARHESKVPSKKYR